MKRGTQCTKAKEKRRFYLVRQLLIFSFNEVFKRFSAITIVCLYIEINFSKTQKTSTALSSTGGYICSGFGGMEL